MSRRKQPKVRRPAPTDARSAHSIRSRTSIAHLLLISALTFAAYVGSFDGQFVSDDVRRVQENELLRSLHWSNVKEIFTSFDGSNYMPFKVLSLAIDYQLWGLEPAGYHLSNLLLHIGCALLVYGILLRFGIGAVASFLTAALWSVHPLQVESVAWISERKNVLSALFFFWAFYLYLGYTDDRTPKRYAAILLLYVLAILSKMNTMVLPAIFLAYETMARFRLKVTDVLGSMPFFAGAGLAAWYNLSGNPIHGTEWHGGTRVVSWLTSSVVVFRYLGKMLAPVHLGSWYEVTLRGSLADPAVMAALLGIAAIGTAAVWLVVTRRPGGFWIAWFWITLLPMLNVVVPFRSMMQDRYMHLALLGPLALAATGLDRLTAPSARKGVSAVAVAAVVACIVVSYRQVEMWTTPFTLWRAGAQQRVLLPGQPGTYRSKMHHEQVAFLEELAPRRSSDPIVRHNLGAFYFWEGNFDAAIPELEAAAALAPNNPNIALTLARAYGHVGRLQEAEQLLQRAIELDPWFSLHRVHLARVYLVLGKTEAAREQLDAFMRLRPESEWALVRERAYLRQLEAQQKQGP